MNDKFPILIVDDISDNLLALKALLERKDVDIYKATSGTVALELMMEHDFCLAILDVNMPGMSGFELAELMRGSKKTKNIPIIFVTATAKEQNFSFKGYESGAVDFLLKPLDSHAMKSKVNIFIELYQQKKELKNQLVTIAGLLTDLNKSKEDAEKANAAKTQFLAHMSHEIRSPVGAVLGFTDLMKNPANTPEKNHDYMIIVERNSRQLLKLIDDILDLSKVEAGKMTIENIPFSLAEMLAGFISIMKDKAEKKGIQFYFNAETLIPDKICCDSFRLQQILTNIVGNAIKFTNTGSVEMNIAFTNPVLKFTIKDSGAGFTKEQQSKLFQPFSQADTSTNRKFGGTGLGLVLSKHLVELLGGKIEIVESTEDRGSTFLIELNSELLPQAKLVGKEALTTITGAVPVFQANSNVLQGLKVLLVDDSLDRIESG